MCSKCSSTTRQQAHEPFFCQRTLQSAREKMREVREDEKPTEVTWVYGIRLQPDSQGSMAKNCQDAAVIFNLHDYMLCHRIILLIFFSHSIGWKLILIQSQICRMCLRQAIMTCQGDGRKIMVLSRPRWKCESAFQNRSLYVLSMPLTHTTYSTSHIDQIFYNQIISQSTSVPKQKWTSM